MKRRIMALRWAGWKVHVVHHKMLEAVLVDRYSRFGHLEQEPDLGEFIADLGKPELEYDMITAYYAILLAQCSLLYNWLF